LGNTDRNVKKFVEETIMVDPGSYSAYPVAVDLSRMPDCHITGSFSASGGAKNDIQFFVFTDEAYEDWRYRMSTLAGGFPAKTPAIFFTEPVTEGHFDIPIVKSGTYFLVFTNHFSSVKNKVVKVEIELVHDVVQAARRR
jgi:hypothetical protein